MFFSGLFFGAGVTLLVNYLIDKSKVDKERADYMQAEIDALRSALMGEAEEDTEGDE